MEFKGTKGEWEILAEDNYGIYIGSETTEGNAIVKCFKNNPHLNYAEAKANAQLIASTPKLLEALIELKKWVGQLEDWKGQDPPCELVDEAIKQALA